MPCPALRCPALPCPRCRCLDDGVLYLPALPCLAPGVRACRQVVEHHGYAQYDTRVYILCTLPFVLLFILVRDLQYLSWSSMLANVLIFVGMIICFVFMLSDVPSPSERDAVGHYSTIPLYFSTVIFALEGIGVVRVCPDSAAGAGLAVF